MVLAFISQKPSFEDGINYCEVQAAAECKQRLGTTNYQKTRNLKWNSNIVHFLCIVFIILYLQLTSSVKSFLATPKYTVQTTATLFFFLPDWEKICTPLKVSGQSPAEFLNGPSRRFILYEIHRFSKIAKRKNIYKHWDQVGCHWKEKNCLLVSRSFVYVDIRTFPSQIYWLEVQRHSEKASRFFYEKSLRK